MDVQKLIEDQLPGWRLAAPVLAPVPEKMDTGPTLEYLRHKFLGERRTVLVEPINGGPAKTADIINGKVVIVQG